MSKNTMKRILLTAVAALMLVTMAVGGTLAWLTAESSEVTNTFTATGIAIKLDEGQLVAPTDTTPTYTLGTTRVQANQYPLIPGNSYPKDPTVTVESTTNVDVYLFVKFDEVNNPSTYLTYDVVLDDGNNGWNKVTGEENVWYREVKVNDETKSWVLLNNATTAGVTIKDTVDKNNMSTAANAQLKFDAWAVQMDNMTVTEAWAQVNPDN